MTKIIDEEEVVKRMSEAGETIRQAIDGIEDEKRRILRGQARINCKIALAVGLLIAVVLGLISLLQ